MGEFNSDDHYIYYCGQESLRRNGVAIIVNKRVWNAVLECNLKKKRMISVRFQGKPFNITVIQVYAPASNAQEAQVEWFYENLQDLLELTPKKDVLFIIGDWNANIIRVAYKNELLDVEAIVGDWAKVITNGRTLYATLIIFAFQSALSLRLIALNTLYTLNWPVWAVFLTAFK